MREKMVNKDKRFEIIPKTILHASYIRVFRVIQPLLQLQSQLCKRFNSVGTWFNLNVTTTISQIGSWILTHICSQVTARFQDFTVIF